MNPQKMISNEVQKVEEDIQTLRVEIAELYNILRAKELELVEKKREEKGLKVYSIEWVKWYFAIGTEEIEASTEEEALQIAMDNIGEYQGDLDWDYDKNEVYSCGEIE